MNRHRLDESVEAFAAGPDVQRLVAADLSRPLVRGPGPGFSVADIFACFREQGIDAWLVGGAPRDWLEGRICGDMDIACRAGFGSLKQRFTRAFRGGEILEEYAGFGLFRWASELAELDFNILRTLPEPDPERSMFEQKNQPTRFLSADAALRDFTLNAIYYSPDRGLFLDPTRRGLDAIRDRILEFAGPPHLAEANPFLSLRVVKFMAKGYRPGPEVERFVRLRLEGDLDRMDPLRLAGWLWRQVPAGRMGGFCAVLTGLLAREASRQRVLEVVAGLAPVP